MYNWNNLINWLALLRTPGVGPKKFKEYLTQDPALENLPEIAKNTFKEQQRLLEADLKWVEQPNCHIILSSDKAYPELLKNIAAMPPVLFVKGNKAILKAPQIAIVGSRKATKIGEQTAFNFAKELAENRLVLTSGLALGIDAASHKGALAVKGGSTIAVLGHGLDQIYPRQHTSLAARIIACGGAIVSEFPLGVTPQANNFPRRNRIISGLSLGVVIIEAGERSGSLITANYALDQGREVFAVPGSIYEHNYKGCNQLIKQGAKLIDCTAEILEELDLTAVKVPLANKWNLNQDADLFKKLSKVQIKILHSISYEVTAPDLIIDRSGLIASEVNAELTNLELSGYITAVPGGYTRSV